MTFADNSFTYDGTVKALAVSGMATDATVLYANNSQTNAGTYTVTATVSRPNYTAAVLSAELIINKAAQTITFNTIPRKSLEDDVDFQLNARASSGLAVTYTFTYSSAMPAASVNATGFVNLLTSGNIQITASQEGNTNYLAATEMMRELSITSKNATISRITIAGQVIDAPARQIYYLLDCNDTISSVAIEINSEANAFLSTGSTFTVNTPKAGVYRNTISVTSQDGTQTINYELVIEKAFQFADIIAQKYNNSLIVNNNPNTNGGYSFTSFKWFKNGVLVSEKQLFSEGNSADNLLDPNATYQAIMVTEDGDELRTCVFDVILEARKGLSLLQNPVVKGTALKVRADFSKEELKEAVFYLYDTNGRLLKTIKATGVENTIQLPSSIARGVYNLVLMNSKGKSFQRFLVK